MSRLVPACLVLLIATAGSAQTSDPAGPAPALAEAPAGAPAPDAAVADPPAVVGRIVEVSGSVSYRGSAGGAWENAETNTPIVAGDAVYAAARARARLEVGSATVLVRENAELDLVTLDDRSVSVRIDLGSASLQTAAGAEPLSIATPRGVASLGPDGLYRVTAGNAEAPTEVAVCRGGASLADGQTRLREGQLARLTGDATAPRIDISAAPPSACEAVEAAPQTTAAIPAGVSRRITGIADLGRRGRWASAPAQGPTWYPDDVPADWAPYKHGRWKWVAPWGWTWIDDASWGFAPFHYGRWASTDGRWGWVPGEYREAPVYAPALVAFVDVPPGAVVLDGPALGWIPLAPGEIYRPYYYAGPAYWQRVNVGVVVGAAAAATIAAAIVAPLAVSAYRNSSAAIVAPRAAVVAGQPIAPAATLVRPGALASAPVRGPGSPPVAPPTPRSGGVPAGRPVAQPPQLGPMPAGYALSRAAPRAPVGVVGPTAPGSSGAGSAQPLPALRPANATGRSGVPITGPGAGTLNPGTGAAAGPRGTERAARVAPGGPGAPATQLGRPTRTRTGAGLPMRQVGRAAMQAQGRPAFNRPVLAPRTVRAARQAVVPRTAPPMRAAAPMRAAPVQAARPAARSGGAVQAPRAAPRQAPPQGNKDKRP